MKRISICFWDRRKKNEFQKKNFISVFEIENKKNEFIKRISYWFQVKNKNKNSLSCNDPGDN